MLLVIPMVESSAKSVFFVRTLFDGETEMRAGSGAANVSQFNHKPIYNDIKSVFYSGSFRDFFFATSRNEDLKKQNKKKNGIVL